MLRSVMSILGVKMTIVDDRQSAIFDSADSLNSDQLRSIRMTDDPQNASESLLQAIRSTATLKSDGDENHPRILERVTLRISSANTYIAPLNGTGTRGSFLDLKFQWNSECSEKELTSEC